MIEFIERYKNNADILTENIKVLKGYIDYYEFFGRDLTSKQYPYCTYSIEEIKISLKLARKYLRVLKKGDINE